MVLHVFTSFLGGVPLCIPYGLYSGTSLGGTTWRTLGGYPGRVQTPRCGVGLRRGMGSLRCNVGARFAQIFCDAPFPRGPIDHRQPTKTCVSHIMRPIC